MPYSTTADLQNHVGAAKLVELADLDADGSADTAVLTDAIAAADEFINSYAQRRYAVPFATAPPIVKRYSVEEAIYRLLLGRNAVTDQDAARREERIAWLEDLSKGIVSVGVNPEPAKSDAHVADAVGDRDDQTDAIADGAVLTRKSLEGVW
jgi:phage gp36-like protein